MLNDLHAADSHSALTKVPADLSKFWVVTVISNPMRFKRRTELYWRFAEMCNTAGINLITVEEAFGNRKFMVTTAGNKYHLQVRSEEVLWKKENLINIGIRHAQAIAPGQCREVAWIDADCRPACPPREWFENTWHELQHHEFVQMWESMIDLDINNQPIGGPQPAFMYHYFKYGAADKVELREIENYNIKKGITVFGRPGLAWAANVSALNKVGGLIDCSILGAGDHYMAHGLIGTMSAKLTQGFQGLTGYEKRLLHWQELAERWIKRDVGVVSGLVMHDFHGRKDLRGYGTRGKILVENQFNPETDIKYDTQGLLQLETWEPRQVKLRDQIRAYFRSRSEDSTDL
jgi:hypothetical protein